MSIGIADTTLRDRLKVDEFRQMYHNARMEVVQAAILRIQAASEQAVEALVEIGR